MAANARFESNSQSPEGSPIVENYTNGQRGNCSSAFLDRSGSFRESSGSGMLSSGNSTSRGSTTWMGSVPPLSQCLLLDPSTLGDQKHTRCGEIKRIMGISIGSSAEDSSLGATHLKTPSQVAAEDIKRFRASVLDSSIQASGRAKRFNESIRKLNKYSEALNFKRQQRNEMLPNERSAGPNLLKTATFIQRNPSDLVTQRLGDGTKNAVLSKRVRTSVAEIRAEGRRNILVRQPLVTGKDREIVKDGGEISDHVEEKIRRLPVGGEGWEKRMKRKRSVSTVITRSVDSDGELKRVMHHKPNNDHGLQPCDTQVFRSVSFNDASGINKLDSVSLTASSNARVIPKDELGKVSLSRDLMVGSTKDRLVTKGNNKLNVRDDNNNVVSPGPVTKGKASRGPRSGPVLSANSSPTFSYPSGVDGCEQSPGMNKVHSASGVNSHKLSMHSGSSSPPMAQWVGQRPQKMSRTRRANLVSPVSNDDEMQIPSEGCPLSNLGARVTSVGTNGVLHPRVIANGNQQVRVKHENISSPLRFSESEESGAGEISESRVKEKRTGCSEVEERALTAFHNFGPSVLLAKKNKIIGKDETGDGVRRQGRSGRVSLYSRVNVSPMREKVASPASAKPLKSSRPSSDKNGSKSGRPPLKKGSERKAFNRLGHAPVGSSPDLTGEPDDDREELLAAANFACNASYLACSGSFWKKMEPFFASVNFEDISSLKQQGGLVDEENCVAQHCVSGEREGSQQDQRQSKESASTAELVDQVQDIGSSGLRLGSERCNKVTPLYQRVLSALIIEDEIEELKENNGGGNMSFQYSGDGSSGDTGLSIDVEPWNKDEIESQYESIFSMANSFSCNGSTTCNKEKGIQKQLSTGDLSRGSCGHEEIGMLPEFSEGGGDGSRVACTNASGVSSPNCPYKQMPLEDKLVLELQSIGLYPDTVPDLADGEEDQINQQIAELHKRLQHHIGQRRTHLSKIIKTIEEVKEVEERRLVQVAMDRLVQLAHKKLLATRGSIASKSGMAKVPKPVALAFMKRTLARCRKFEESGRSCFDEPGIRDVIFASSRGNVTESMNCFSLGMTARPESYNSQPECRIRGSLSHKAEHHNLHNDQVGTFDELGTLTHSSNQDFIKSGPILTRGKKKEVLLDDVGGSASLRDAALGNALLAGSKGKSREKERDKDISAKDLAAKGGRASLGNFKGEHKTKSKPKQKTAQLSTSGNGYIDKLYFSADGSSELATNGSNEKIEVGSMPVSNSPHDLPKEIKESMQFANLQDDLDIAELGMPNDYGGHHDLSTLFNFDDDCLHEHDSVGLDIPMDDLSELNMLI